MYTAQVEVTEENVQSLLPAANLLQLTDVRDACCDFLQAQLHPTNCLGIRRFLLHTHILQQLDLDLFARSEILLVGSRV